MKKRVYKELVAALVAPDGALHPDGRRELRLRDPQAGQAAVRRRGGMVRRGCCTRFCTAWSGTG